MYPPFTKRSSRNSRRAIVIRFSFATSRMTMVSLDNLQADGDVRSLKQDVLFQVCNPLRLGFFASFFVHECAPLFRVMRSNSNSDVCRTALSTPSICLCSGLAAPKLETWRLVLHSFYPDLDFPIPLFMNTLSSLQPPSSILDPHRFLIICEGLKGKD